MGVFGRWTVVSLATAAATAGAAAGVLALPLKGEAGPIWAGIVAALVAAGGFAVGARWVGDSGLRVTAAADGSVAAGGSINADIDIETDGQVTTPQDIPGEGVRALGSGSVASAGKIKGKIKIRNKRSQASR